MISRGDSMVVSIKRQCELLKLSRSGFYYQKTQIPDECLDLMEEIDKLHIDFPFMGSRQITRVLQRKGFCVHRSRIQRLMSQMGIAAIAPGPHTSKKHPSHPVYPYLLNGLIIDRPDQVWTTDITYIPFRKGFFYLVAIQDWHSRKILSWRLSNTLDISFCLDALAEALSVYGAPEIFNTDQGSHFTSHEWTDELKAHGIAISMDGKGRALDNIMIERFWRSLKYEHIYLNPADDGISLERGIREYIEWYNAMRPHSSLGGSAPNQTYRGGSQSACAA